MKKVIIKFTRPAKNKASELNADQSDLNNHYLQDYPPVWYIL